jgi:hypothetical protein
VPYRTEKFHCIKHAVAFLNAFAPATFAGHALAGRELLMNMYLSIGPLVSLVAGILILVVPRLLNYIVAIYLIVIGLIGLFGNGAFK